jgi:hypothetical protein
MTFDQLRYLRTVFAGRRPQLFGEWCELDFHDVLQHAIATLAGGPPFRTSRSERLAFEGAASFAFFLSAKGAVVDVALLNLSPRTPTSFPKMEI